MARNSVKKRGQGRPSDNTVGRDLIRDKTVELLQTHPPARVTLTLIAREAGVDPALIRYYFGNREKLLLEVVEHIFANAPVVNPAAVAPASQLEQIIRFHGSFARSTRHVHRLMVDELADAKSAEVRRMQGEMNRRAVARLEELMASDEGEHLRQINPEFLHLALVGLFDFFVSAQSVVRNLVPEDTDMEGLALQFEDFVVDLVLNGVSPR